METLPVIKRSSTTANAIKALGVIEKLFTEGNGNANQYIKYNHFRNRQSTQPSATSTIISQYHQQRDKTLQQQYKSLKIQINKQQLK